ncbi:Serine/threonine-protein kinase 10 [Armadillidium vulgare]|nr:Serine/threonine-protein kinase 10 [Armadillidium vulgare]
MSLLSKVKDIFKGGSSAKKKKVYHNVKLDNPEETWRVIGELGDGAYGKVYKAEHRATGQSAALKQVLLEAEDDLDTFMIEIDILCECKHPNIVELLEAYHYDGKLWMYLEYCDGGAVDSIMVDLDRPLNEDQIAILCFHLCHALDYIHSNKVIHRDLKAGNVLLTMEGGKLADFGVSAKNKNTYDKRGTFIGTPYWLAPEVILCETFIDAKYDYKADIWSLGISLIEFAQLDPPNHEVSPVRVMLKIQKSDPPKLDFPSKWSKEFNDFIAKCLTKDPVQRPDAQELLKHPFLCKPLDKKPIIDLLLEYKAEVVEEDYEDDNPCRVNSISEPFNDASKFDSESIISVDKERTPVSSVNDKPPSPTVEDKEVPLSVSEKRLSKGPAPLPPSINTNAQPSPKKGPAPAVPPTTSAPVSTPTVSAPSVVTLSQNISNTEKVTINESSVSDVNVRTPVVATSLESPTVKDTSTSVSVSNIIEEKIVPTPSIDSSSPVASPDSVLSDNRYIPEVSDDVLSTKTDNETLIDSIPVGKRVYVYDPEQLDSGTVTVNNTSVSEKVHIEPGTSQTVISSGGIITTSTEVVSMSVETHHEEVANISVSTSDANLSTLPVMLSVVSTTPSNATEDKPSLASQSSPSDVLLASISSEGTVIVRTPTPTPSDSNVATVMSRRNDNVVTYTVAQNSESNSLEKELRVSQSESQEIFLLEQSITADNSLPEAEAQAVMILETAINSALDSSLSQLDSFMESKGEVVIIASEVDDAATKRVSTSDELEKSIINDVSGHKLDESEVFIISSSVPEDEEKEPNKRDDHPASIASESPVASKVNKEGGKDSEHHVSVVSVDEDKEEVKIVGETSLTSSEVILDASESTQMSLTIEGTTLEDTDVDEVENSTSSPSSSINEPLTQVKESVINSNAKEQNKIGITSFGSPSSPSTEEIDSSVSIQPKITDQSDKIPTTTPLQPIQNGIRRQSSRASDRSDSDTTSIIGSDKENRHQKVEEDSTEEVTLRRAGGKASNANSSPLLNSSELAAKNLKNKELQASIALRKKTRKRTRKFVIDGVVVTTTTSKVIYGDDEEQGMLSSAHLKRKQELRELKLVQKREQKQFQDLSAKATIARQEQEKKFEIEKTNLLRNYDSQIENLTRQQKQLVEKAEARQESELKNESKKIRIDQEREMKAFRESLKQEWKLLKQEVDLLPKDKRKENFKIRKEQLEQDQAKKEKEYLEKLNENHENALKRLNDKHRKHIALKERQFLEEKHQLQRSRESALWDMEERHIQDKHQLAKEQLKDIYFLQRLQMTIRHNVELDQVRRFNQQKEDELIKRQHEERRQLPKRIRQEMKTREKMFREQIRISMTQLPSHEQEKEQLKKFQEQEKIKYDKERKRAEMKHKKQMEELVAGSESSIKELVHLQNEKGKLLTEHETYKLKNLDEEYQKELKEWKSNLAPRKHKLEEDFERQLREQENFYEEEVNNI